MHECKECGRKFEISGALEQHIKDKHKKQDTTHKKSYRKYYVAAILAVIIIISGIVLLGQTTAKYNVRTVDGDNFLGPENAFVVITEFSDFQCPFCARFHRETFPQLKEEYIDTGKVRFVFKHYPLQGHNNARKAAEASECASDIGGQQAFWDIAEKMFVNNNFLSISNLKKFASDMQLNTTAFDSCLDSGAMTSRVDSDLKDGQSLSVSSTPTFFINSQKLEGAQPYSAFKDAIDAQLSVAQ